MRLISKLVAIALLPATSALASGSQTAVMDLQNVQCYACLNAVNKALQKVPGVEGTKLDLEKKTATVKFNPAKTNSEALLEATAKAVFLQPSAGKLAMAG